MKSKRQFTLERLEDRLTPAAYGALWSDASHLTLSFAQDGTDTSAGKSNLFSSLATFTSQSSWEQTLLRAFQTWAVNSNVNIGVVADNGSALGTPGLLQGDDRFGDVRIAGTPLPNKAVGTTNFVVPGSTWSGDMILNTNYAFGAGAGEYDLFSVALHEAGHVFGLQDNADVNSVMFTQYRGVYTGLMANDVAAIQGVYGTRPGEGQDNSTIQRATELTAAPNSLPGAALTFVGDIGTNQDVDVYHFKMSSAFSQSGGVEVTLRAAGRSLLQGKVTVLDRAGNVIATASAADPLHNDVVLQLSQLQQGADYYVRVQGATSDVFGIGAYQLVVAPQTQWSITTAGFLNGIQDLRAPSGSPANAPLVGYGNINPNTTSGLFRFQVPGSSSSAAGVNITLKEFGVGTLDTTVTVYTASGKVVATATATADADGFLSLRLPTVAPATYYVMVQSGVRGSTSIGAYTLQVDLHPDLNAPVTEESGLLVTAAKANNTLSSAVTLQTLTGFASQSKYETIASLTGPADADFYRVRSIKVAKGQTSVLTATVMAEDAGAITPVITVYDSNRNVVDATVLTNDDGVFVVKINAASNADYYIKVTAGVGSGTKGGNYFLSVDDSPQQVIGLQTVSMGTLTQETPAQTGAFTLIQNQLFNFILSASQDDSTQPAAVRMSVYDANGTLVFSLVAYADQPAATNMVYLGAGSYTMKFEAIGSAGLPLPSVGYSLSLQNLSEPIDPVPIDPTKITTSSPTSNTTTTTTTTATTTTTSNPSPTTTTASTTVTATTTYTTTSTSYSTASGSTDPLISITTMTISSTWTFMTSIYVPPYSPPIRN